MIKTNKQTKDPLNSTWLYCKNKNSQIKLTAHLKKQNRYCFTYPATSPKDKISSCKWTDEEEADRQIRHLDRGDLRTNIAEKVTAKHMVTQSSTLEDSRPNFTSQRGGKNYNLKPSKITSLFATVQYFSGVQHLTVSLVCSVSAFSSPFVCACCCLLKSFFVLSKSLQIKPTNIKTHS